MSKFTQGMQKLNNLFNAEKINIDAFADQVVRSRTPLMQFQAAIQNGEPVHAEVTPSIPTHAAAPATAQQNAQPSAAPFVAPQPQQAPAEYADEQMATSKPATNNDEPPEGFEPPPPSDDDEEAYSYGNDDNFNEDFDDFG